MTQKQNPAQQVQRQYEKLKALHLHATKLAETQNIKEIAEHTVDAMYTALGLERNYFMIIEDENLSVISIKSERVKEHHLDPTKDPMYTVPLTGNSVTARAATSKKSLLVQDVLKDPEWENVYDIPEDQVRRCEVAVPVIVSNEVVAVLHTESHLPNYYNEQDLELLETLASHVGSAIQRIRLLEEQIQYEAKLEALHMHANKLADASSFEEIEAYTKEALRNTVRPDMLSWGDLGFVEGDVIKYEAPTEYPLDGPGIIVRAVRTGETQIVTDTREDVDFIGIHMDERTWSRITEEERKRQTEFRELGEEQVLSEIEVPVKIGDTVIAVIGGESTELNSFNKQDQELLETLASHVGSAIQRIRLLEEQIQYEAKLKALHQHAIQLSKAEDIDEIADCTVDAMSNTLGYYAGLFCMVETDHIRSLRSLGDYTYIPDPIPLDSLGLINKTVRTGETQFVNDTRLDMDYRTSGTRYLSEIDVPLIIEDKVMGVLNIESLELNAFTEQDQILLETLGNHVTSAIMRLQHYDERERVQQELAVERVRVEQADELSRLKNQFISTATHELRTPVTSILGFLEIVLDYSSKELPGSVRKDLGVVFRNALRLVDMTNDLLDVQRITSGRFEITLEQVDLVNTLNEVVEELTPLFNEKQQVLVVEAPGVLSVNVDEVRISQLFINLIRNANKFTPEEGNITVKVEPVEGHVQVSVKDSGIGLREEDIGKLFKPFPAIRHGVNVSSTGLGLAICKGIVDLHEGEIWVESDGPGTGSTFIVIIPVNQ